MSSQAQPSSGFLRFALASQLREAADKGDRVTFRVSLVPASTGLESLAAQEGLEEEEEKKKMGAVREKRKAVEGEEPLAKRRRVADTISPKNKKHAARDKPTYLGLANQLNTCYLNSMLQCLYHLRGKCLASIVPGASWLSIIISSSCLSARLDSYVNKGGRGFLPLKRPLYSLCVYGSM